MRPSIAMCLFLLTAFCIAAPGKTPAGASHNVSIKGMKFDPAEIQIAVGDTVVWKNQDDRDHTVMATDGSFKSENLTKGDTFQHTFSKAGKFSYACSYHPRMKAVVIVKGS